MAYSEEKFNDIITFIEDGLSLRKAAIKVGISTRSFYNWIEKDVELQQQYARATISRADSIFEEILDIADDSSGDKKYTENGEVMDSEYVQRSRLRVDARKWAVSKMNPKKYGDKYEVDATITNKLPTREEREKYIKEVNDSLIKDTSD